MPSNLPSMPKKLSLPAAVIFGLAGFALCAIIVSAVLMVYTYKSEPTKLTAGDASLGQVKLPESAADNGMMPTDKTQELVNNLTTGTDEIILDDGRVTNLRVTSNQENIVLKFDWETPKSVDANLVFPEMPYYQEGYFSNLIRKGIVKSEKYRGYILYIWERPLADLCMGRCVYGIKLLVSPNFDDIAIIEDGEILKKNGANDYFSFLKWLYGNYEFYPNIQIATTALPQEITLDNGKKLKALNSWYDYTINALCTKDYCTNEKPAYISKEGWQLFSTEGGNVLYTYDELGNPAAFVSYIQPTSDDLGAIQSKVIDWSKDYDVVDTKYTSYGSSGCAGALMDVIKDEEIGNLMDWQKVGMTQEGELIYTTKDPSSSKLVRQAYDGWMSYDDGGNKPDFEAFMKQYPVPLFIWKDAFGRWMKYTVSDILPSAECGKPVIYLYPTSTTVVDVKLPKFINVTVSDPTYPAQGWKVLAKPTGDLLMLNAVYATTSASSTYGSLFWEGTGVGYQTPTTGFVVKDGDQEIFLRTVLAKYGLNKKESAEFMEFWLPLMQGAPYYRVSFLTDEWSKAAPLYVSPKPQTSIRIFMDWQKLKAPIKLTTPKIVTPVRKGFTLVEWGGLLQK